MLFVVVKIVAQRGAEAFLGGGGGRRTGGGACVGETGEEEAAEGVGFRHDRLLGVFLKKKTGFLMKIKKG